MEDEPVLHTDSPLIAEEHAFLKENLQNFSSSEDYAYGFIDGDKDKLESILERYGLISCSCFVRAERHSREHNINKRYSVKGKNAYLY